MYVPDCYRFETYPLSNWIVLNFLACTVFGTMIFMQFFSLSSCVYVCVCMCVYIYIFSTTQLHFTLCYVSINYLINFSTYLHLDAIYFYYLEFQTLLLWDCILYFFLYSLNFFGTSLNLPVILSGSRVVWDLFQPFDSLPHTMFGGLNLLYCVCRLLSLRRALSHLNTVESFCWTLFNCWNCDTINFSPFIHSQELYFFQLLVLFWMPYYTIFGICSDHSTVWFTLPFDTAVFLCCFQTIWLRLGITLFSLFFFGNFPFIYDCMNNFRLISLSFFRHITFDLSLQQSS